MKIPIPPLPEAILSALTLQRAAITDALKARDAHASQVAELTHTADRLTAELSATDDPDIKGRCLKREKLDITRRKLAELSDAAPTDEDLRRAYDGANALLARACNPIRDAIAAHIAGQLAPFYRSEAEALAAARQTPYLLTYAGWLAGAPTSMSMMNPVTSARDYLANFEALIDGRDPFTFRRS